MAQKHVSRSLLVSAVVPALVGLGLAGASPASAATYTVTTTADGGGGSLRAAVRAASASGTASVVSVPAGTYQLTLCGADDTGADDTGAAGDLDLNTAALVTIRGTGAVTIRQTCAGERVLQAAGGGRLALEGLAITGGSVTAPAGTVAQGGGVLASSDVGLLRTTISGNSVRGADGADAASTTANPGNGTAARGGGLSAGGALVMADSTLSGNSATGGLGGATPDGSTISGGRGGDADGGGAYVTGAVGVTGGGLSGNRATAGTGGTAQGVTVDADNQLVRVAFGGPGGAARGGGIAQAAAATAPVGLARTTTSANVADGGEAGVYRVPANSLNGPFIPGAAPAAGAATGGAVAAAGTLGAATVTSNGDQALGGNSDGGRCLFCQSGPPSGAATGGSLATTGAAAVTGSTFTNSAALAGQAAALSLGRIGIIVGYPSGDAHGGAVAAGGNLTVASGSMTGNRSLNGDGTAGDGSGGGAWSGAALSVTGGTYSGNLAGFNALQQGRGHGAALAGASVSLRDVTATGNTSTGEGGAADASTGTLTATGSTITGNHGGQSGGGLSSGGAVTLTDVQVRDNDAVGRGRVGTGGGIAAGGAVTLTRATVTGNRVATTWTAPGFGDFPGDARGGGVFAASVTASASTVSGNTLNGLELSSNAARTAQSTGGGIFASGDVALTGTTLVDNVLSVGFTNPGVVLARAGGISGATVQLTDAQLSGNAVVDLRNPGTPPPDGGTLQADALGANGSTITAAPGQRACTAPAPTPLPSSNTTISDDTCGLSGPGVVIGS